MVGDGSFVIYSVVSRFFFVFYFDRIIVKKVLIYKDELVVNGNIVLFRNFRMFFK